ncbi:energy transducer TonB [Methylomonas sp. SURF-2]|uniref:Protein TonB n=1 Tax=Methylomonas subterranea TaxID=2952225 RepID=A0ABT1TKN8_9GAMM|nr:energy transducer TonB [Methylomonas sp. SURF-2]MCQ8105781.1 energy transducer TonB [Methylomonas sp. SURF-2]
MSNPLRAFSKFEPPGNLNWQSPGSLALQSAGVGALEPLVASADGSVLKNFKYTGDNRDAKWADYLILGFLSILIHSTVVNRFDRLSLEQEIVEPPKAESKVQITLARPQPKPVPPPPVVIPPVQKVVPLKPQKPKPKPKVVEQAPVVQTPVVSDAPPSPAPVYAPPAPPAPVVEEKITLPSAGADYLNNPAPEYPEIAQERGWEGKVLMKVHVKPDGKPDQVSVIKSSGQKVLDDAAVKTVYKWSFVPAKRGETPIAGNVTVPITFNLS